MQIFPFLNPYLAEFSYRLRYLKFVRPHSINSIDEATPLWSIQHATLSTGESLIALEVSFRIILLFRTSQGGGAYPLPILCREFCSRRDWISFKEKDSSRNITLMEQLSPSLWHRKYRDVSYDLPRQDCELWDPPVQLGKWVCLSKER